VIFAVTSLATCRGDLSSPAPPSSFPGPDHARRDRRLRDRRQRAELDVAFSFSGSFVVRSGPRLLPAVAAVHRSQQHLRAQVDDARVVGERWMARPVERYGAPTGGAGGRSARTCRALVQRAGWPELRRVETATGCPHGSTTCTCRRRAHRHQSSRVIEPRGRSTGSSPSRCPAGRRRCCRAPPCRRRRRSTARAAGDRPRPTSRRSPREGEAAVAREDEVLRVARVDPESVVVHVEGAGEVLRPLLPPRLPAVGVIDRSSRSARTRLCRCSDRRRFQPYHLPRRCSRRPSSSFTHVSRRSRSGKTSRRDRARACGRARPVARRGGFSVEAGAG